jgi:hypothetical protein
MKLKLRVYQHLVRTTCVIEDDVAISDILSSDCVSHAEGIHAGELVSLDEVEKVFTGRMPNFSITTQSGLNSDLYNYISDWMKSVAAQTHSDDEEVEDSDDSLTLEQ